MSTDAPVLHELLIPSLTPQNLERVNLPCPPNARPVGAAGGWFKENSDAIKKAVHVNPWWQKNILILEMGKAVPPSVCARSILNLGYERVGTVRGQGLFAVRGGIIEIWPIQSPKPLLIEFRGNTIETIRERPEIETSIKPRMLARREVEDLVPGSFVVHVDHGIGIFRGKTPKDKFSIINYQFSNNGAGAFENWPLEIENSTKNSEEFFVVEYAPAGPGREPDRLYVPANQKNRLAPYVGFETPRIHRLGGSVWHTTKRKTREDTERLARELLELYAQRHDARRPPHEGDPALEEELRETFPYLETEDQIRAEHEILRDLERDTPMDRILCGDVGFGKTEVALRAAFRVIASGKQVALLSPTTILAAQHECTFRERLRQLPVRVAMLSRLTPKKDEQKVLEDIQSGRADCVIGTHRLLSQDIEFKNLGLVIIDEEQRFGVKQKEKFKELRLGVDMLSLSATPIPRTMQLSLARLRDISLIETPPPERKQIHTLVLPYTKKIIRTAIEFELARRGQIYFLHNRIETIGHVREKLRALKFLRPLKIEIMHGRMKEQEVLHAMELFREGHCDILLATTIIENGLDISRANTLIVDDATRLGLAEAHQLRGRIGRGSTQAFSYFLYKPNRLTDKASERLEALQEYSELGSGYQIALRDLEIRGAGNILGREQSGAINKVGLNLYYQMLAEAIEEERAKTKPS